MANVYALLRPFVAISFLRSGPQDLPHSLLLLLLAATAYLGLGIISYAMVYSPGAAVILSTADLAMVCALVTATLLTHGHKARIAQTLSAILGSGAVMATLVLPASSWLAAGHQMAQPSADRFLVSLALIAWGLTVNGHILRHALSSAMGLGMAFSVLYFFIIINAMRALRVSLQIS